MFFRAPNTINEKRQNALFLTERADLETERGKVTGRVRSGRDGHGLPDAWDDITVRTQRTWKKYRRTQRHSG